MARTLVAALGLDDVAAGAAVVALGADEAVAVWPLGELLSSSANLRISKPSITLPLLAVTFCVTLVFVIEMIFPTGAFSIPLSINSWTPSTTGMVKLVLNLEVLISLASHFGGKLVVLVAVRP